MSELVEQLLEAMTLEERIGQITQIDRTAVTPERWLSLASARSCPAGVAAPTRTPPRPGGPWSTSTSTRRSVRGSASRSVRHRRGPRPLQRGRRDDVPHNIGLGTAGDPELVAAIGRATAIETAATGARWTFAPTVAVPQDPRWGRTYEGYGQDPAAVAVLGAALVDGLQGPGPGIDLLACAKHVIADGGTTWGTTRRGRVVAVVGALLQQPQLGDRPG